MGVDEDSYSTIVVPVILDKIPEAVKLNMIRSTNGHQEWTMNEVVSALEAEIDVREQHTSFFRNTGSNVARERQEWKQKLIQDKKQQQQVHCLQSNMAEDRNSSLLLAHFAMAAIKKRGAKK